MIEEVEVIERINQRCGDALQRFAKACERLAVLNDQLSAARRKADALKSKVEAE